jgi:uncharacterized protein YfaP (DUF2135 family)
MALVVTPAKQHSRSYSALAGVGAGLVIECGTMAFDSSYPTGGEAVTFSIPHHGVIAVFMEPYGGRLYQYDNSNEKIKAYFSRGGTASGVFAEVSNTSDLSAMSNVPYVMFGFASI